MGKAEGTGEGWHGHVTAVTARLCLAFSSRADNATQVAPEYRRQGLAQKLMALLEETSIKRQALRFSNSHP